MGESGQSRLCGGDSAEFAETDPFPGYNPLIFKKRFFFRWQCGNLPFWVW